jgi:hypothetical protein
MSWSNIYEYSRYYQLGVGKDPGYWFQKSDSISYKWISGISFFYNCFCFFVALGNFIYKTPLG